MSKRQVWVRHTSDGLFKPICESCAKDPKNEAINYELKDDVDTAETATCTQEGRLRRTSAIFDLFQF